MSIHEFNENLIKEDLALVKEMSMSIGINVSQDVMLYHHIKELPTTDVDDDYTVVCLLMTYIAVVIPELAYSQNSRFNVITIFQIFALLD